jgi:hypothetical protein
VTIVTDRVGTGVLTYRCVNPWLLPEGNSIAVALAAPDDLSSFSLSRTRAATSVFRAEVGSAPPKPVETYASRRWHISDDPDAGVQSLLPTRFVLRFEVPRPPDCRIFREAEEVPGEAALTDADRAEIHGLAERFREAVAAGRFADAFEVQRARFEDEARSKGHDPARLEAMALKQWAALRRAPDFEAPPLAPEDARLRPYPRLRLVGLERASGGAPVRFRSDGQTLDMALYFARVRGRWLVAR